MKTRAGDLLGGGLSIFYDPGKDFPGYLADMKRFAACLLCCCLLAACRPQTFTPKPRGYYHIELPEHQYQAFDNPDYPYTFEYPVYGKVVRDTAFFDAKPENPYWINIDIPSLSGRIYISYKQISGPQSLEKLLSDAHFMSYYHTKRADYLQDGSFRNEYGVTGLTYHWGGDAASSYQFIATDSIQHFIRGALYFDATPNADSIKPVADFLQKDIEHMLKTMRWQ